MRQGGGDHRPDEDRVAVHIDQARRQPAVPQFPVGEPPLRLEGQRVLQDAVQLRGRQCGLGDAREVDAARCAVMQTPGDGSAKSPAAREHLDNLVIRRALPVPLDAHTPCGGDRALCRVRVVQDEGLRLHFWIGVEDGIESREGDGLATLEALRLGRVPVLVLAGEVHRGDTVEACVACGLLGELPGRRQVGHALALAAAPPLRDQAAHKSLARPGGHLERQILALELLHVSAQDTSLTRMEFARCPRATL